MPSRSTRLMAMRRAAPLSAISLPNTAPRQITTTRDPSRSPIPFSMAPGIFAAGIPSIKAATIAATTNARSGWILPHAIITVSSPTASSTDSRFHTAGLRLEVVAQAGAVGASHDVVQGRVDREARVRLRRRFRIAVRQVVDLEVDHQLLRHVVAAAEVDVGRALHLVVVDGRVDQGRYRAVGLALDVLVAVLAVAEPAFGQRETQLVVIPALRREQLPLRRVAQVDARAFRRDRADDARIRDEVQRAGGQRTDGEAARQVEFVEVRAVRRFDVEAFQMQRGQVEVLHGDVVVARAVQHHGLADLL
ncbi:conserved hypothetical protein, partial [Ricinus communis]